MKTLCIALFMAVITLLPAYAQQPQLPQEQVDRMPIRIANAFTDLDDILDRTAHLEKTKRLDPADARRARNLATVGREALAQAKVAYFNTLNNDRARATKMVEAVELAIDEARQILQVRQRRP